MNNNFDTNPTPNPTSYNAGEQDTTMSYPTNTPQEPTMNPGGYQPNPSNYGQPQRRLYRSTNDQMLLGVCAGISEYFGWDPALVRIFTVLLSLVFNVISPILYFVAAMVMPKQPTTTF